MDRSSYEAEFAELVAVKGPALRRTAHLMCGDWHLAEDLVQGVFVKLHLNWHRIRREDSFDAYLRKILFHAYLDTRRVKWRRETPAAYLPDAEAPGTAPSDDRAVLVLRYWEDLSVEETAGLLGCAAGTVKSQASKGLAALRPLLAGTVFESAAAER